MMLYLTQENCPVNTELRGLAYFTTKRTFTGFAKNVTPFDAVFTVHLEYGPPRIGLASRARAREGCDPSPTHEGEA